METMISKAIHEIVLADLEALKGVARETKTLEFKRELPAGRPGALKVLAGVTALANTSGGDFVIGVAAKAGVADDVIGIQIPDADQYKLTLEQVLASNVEPRLPRIDIQEVDCGNGRWAFVVRVPQSWIGPHRVTSDNNFYVRSSGATVPLGVDELRTAFGLRESGIERIEAFRRERLIKITAGETPVRIQEGPAVVLHMAPLPSFANRDLIDIVRLVANGTHMPLPLRGPGISGYPSANLLGFINFPGDDGKGAAGYGQLFRTGAFEGVSCSSVDMAVPYLGSLDFGNMIVGAVRRHLSLQASYDIAFPTFAMLSFCNASDLRFRRPTEFGGGYYDSNPLGETIVSFPEVLIERPDVDVPTIVRPLLNVVWNAFGFPESEMYTPQGAWKGTA